MQKQMLLGMTLDELENVTRSLNLPRYTAKQMMQWLYVKRISSIDEMTNISLKSRELLKESFDVGRVSPVDKQQSIDGTIKYLYPVDDHLFVETVYIPEDERATLCISSQVGCKMNCKFCMTGKMGFKAQLSSGQIINQILSLPEYDNLTNVVLMGMGEPLDNLGEVLKVLSIMTSPDALGWSPKRITLSSVGLKKTLKQFIEGSNCHLAISLHFPIPSLRAEYMPAERSFSIVEMVELLKQYDFSKQRRLSFEYIVFKGINDSELCAKALIKLLRGLECRINLIRFHAIPGAPFEGVDDEAMEKFRDYLTSHGLFSSIRASRGEDIFAACGMLSTAKAGSKEQKEN